MQQQKQHSTLSLHKLNWLEMNTDGIIGGKAPDGVRYLELFLQDYSREFNNTTLNPSCRKCINDYLNNYKQRFRIMSTDSNYLLHKKRQGIQLEFGSGIFVNNNNITDAYAKKLIKRYKSIQGDKFEMSYLFEKFPVEEKKKRRTRKPKA